MKAFAVWNTLLLTIALFTSAATAQTRPAAVRSPEVQPDRHVTFRIRAPQATDVTINGDWMAPDAQVKLTKDAQGVWSVTLGPLASGISIYNFTVDGLAIADPVNPKIKQRASTSASLLEVPGDGTELWEIQNVPHGKVELNFIPSKVLNDQTREVRVYTPSGYDANGSTKYPVVYLLHGSNDTAAGWTDVGRANYILDNLIAQKKAVPMIVVMPWGHALPYGSPGDNTGLFENYLLQDVMPSIEKDYRAAPGRENRAIVGLSMGGGQAITIGLGHLDLFSAIGAYSAAVPTNFETRYKALLDDPDGTNAKINLFWIGCGRLDSGFSHSQELADILENHHIQHTFVPSDGYHNYTNWRLYLGQTAPLLFREKAK